jgi:hypothetical protein
MKNETVSGLSIALALALIAAALLAVWLIGSATLRTLGLILAIGLTLALVIGASALPIRAWRRKDHTGETHYVHEGTKTIVRETRILDGRTIEAPKVYQLPAPPQGGAFPELLRAAYAAGRISPHSSSLGQPQRGYQSDPDYSEAEISEVDLGDDDGWAGDITSNRP